MKYTKKDIYEGMKLRCIRTAATNRWMIDHVYTTTKDKFGDIILVDDLGTEWCSNLITDFLNDFGHVYFKEENNMQDFKVGDLVEVIENNSHAYKNKFDQFKSGDKAIVTEVIGFNVRICDKGIGDKGFGNLISKKEIKKVEQSPELTEYEEELVLRLAEYIKLKDNRVAELEELKFQIKEAEEDIENKQKQIKEISKKLLTK